MDEKFSGSDRRNDGSAVAPVDPAAESADHSDTWESGPSDPPNLDDGPGTTVEIDIDAPPDDVWPYVSDIEFGAGFSREFVGARWLGEAHGPAVGARFVGSNKNSAIGEWEVECIITACEPPRRFAWSTIDVDTPGARWAYELDAIEGGTRLRHSVVIGPGPSGLRDYIEREPQQGPQAIIGRLANLGTNMAAVVEGIRTTVEVV